MELFAAFAIHRTRRDANSDAKFNRLYISEGGNVDVLLELVMKIHKRVAIQRPLIDLLTVKQELVESYLRGELTSTGSSCSGGAQHGCGDHEEPPE